MIEPATRFHAAAMAAIHADAFPPGSEWSAATFELQLAAPAAFGWIARAGGLVLARQAADEAEILTLAVAAGSRRRGLGRWLLRQAMRTAAERGAARMLLEVGSGNAGARALYQACGFVLVGRRAGYYAGGEDALVMRAGLPAAFPDQKAG